MPRWRNWGRTQSCYPVRVSTPTAESEIFAVLKEAEAAGRRVKVVGAGHSFTDIACTDGIMISLADYDAVLDVDRERRKVTVQAGITIFALNDALAAHGLAMPNLGDIGYQSIAGAISTATHGTGRGFGNLATFVSRMTVLLADGSALHCSPEADPDTFKAAQVSLGALGVISTVTLDVVPAFNLRADEGEASLDETLEQLDDLVDANEHFEFFWFPHTSKVYTKRNNRTDDPPTERSRWKDFRNDILMENVAFGAAVKVGKWRPDMIPGIARNVVASQLGRKRVVQRSDHVFTSPRLVRFSEMEYAIPRKSARDAIRGLRALIDERGFAVNFPVEVRFTAPDDIPLSTAHGRETCYIAVHLAKGMDYRPYFESVEALMMSFDGRPHWGKLHFRDAESLRTVYPRFDDFVRVRDRLDPAGRFRNPYLDRVLGLPGDR